MNYPGNGSLSSAVRDRVVSTFRQTLALYHQRRTDEVVAGCTLILQMDPMFDPARKLIEKTRNPALPIDVDSLLPPEPSGVPTMQQAREAMAARDFERVQQITSAILSDDLLNDDARILGDEAREKLEAGPFVSQFTRRADTSIAAGNMAAAKMDLEKARALDATHPEVVRVTKILATRDAAPTPAAPPPSFVIDGPSAPSGRSATQAADFGFAFEEDKPEEVSFTDFSFDAPAAPSYTTPANDTSDFSAGFSFDTPTPGPSGADPYAPADEFDFATASVVTSSDDEKKIQQFLSDGDRAFSAGDHQQAIDLWSRIFLIDVTNEEASDRIENAKAKRRQIEQSVEPLLSSGVTAFERGNTAQAHTDLTEVLRLDPQNATAKEYLDRLGETVSAPKSQSYIPPSMDDEKLDLGFLDEGPMPSGFESPLIPPPPGSAAAASAPSNFKTTGKLSKPAKAVSASSSRKLPLPLIGAVIGILVLLGGGWFAWQKYQEEPEPVVDAGAGQAIIARATTLISVGKYDDAIKLLQDIKPSDPAHDQALLLIADIRNKRNNTAQLINGVPVEQYYTEHIEAARAAYAARDYTTAKIAFDEAVRVKPLPPDAKEQYDASVQQVAKLNSAKALFAERKYTDAITNLQQLLDEDPTNVAIQRLLTDAHFNQGAVALQSERTADAMRELDQVLKVNPNDETAKRARDLAARYDQEPKDLLYKIYVKYLPLRQPT